MRKRILLAAGIFALLVAGAGSDAMATPPAYSGTYVIADPYNSNDMMFLQCASETAPGASCNTLSSSNTDFLNPFTGASSSGMSYPQGANGILLRIP